MTKTTGERIVEEWWAFINKPVTDPSYLTLTEQRFDLSRRIDEALATDEGEVERLRKALESFGAHKSDCKAIHNVSGQMLVQLGQCDCGLCEALVQKEV